MTISIRISRSEPPVERPVGGFIGAIVGGTQYVQQGSTDVEISADEVAFETAGELAGWVEEVAPVAASTFRHAALGEDRRLARRRVAEPSVTIINNDADPAATAEKIVADLRTTTEAEADANAKGYVSNGDGEDFVDEDAPEPAEDPHGERIEHARTLIRSVISAYGHNLTGPGGDAMLAEKILLELDSNGLVA